MSISVVAWDFVGIIPLSVSLVGIGIMDRFLGKDEESTVGGTESSGTTDESLGAVFEDAVSSDFGDAPEDEGDFGGIGGGDDDWSGFTDDNLDDLDTEGIDTANLESRIDELENDIDAVSSTISTVRSENEEISKQVADVQDNVRKLLEIYEVVTRGSNPFVEDIDGPSGNAGTFGLFDGLPNEPTIEDATSDEPAVDEVRDPGPEDIFVDEDDDHDGLLLDNESAEEEAGEEGADDDDAGMTFEELKAEYDKDRETRDEESDLFPSEASDDDNTGKAVVDPEEAATVEQADGGEGSLEMDGDESAEKPYLRVLPNGYSADVVVMEWLAYLVNHSNVTQTLQAIRYYRNIEWISDTVADELRTFVGGFNAAGDYQGANDGDGETLGIEHHQTSLAFINHLTDKELRYRSFQMGGTRRGV